MTVSESGDASAPTGTAVLSDADLQELRDRAAGYDRENAFPFEDFVLLSRAGYLRALVPVELGGLGLSLAEMVRQQSRLAAAAPATALAVNMHLIWTAVARILRDRGDDSLEYVLTEAAEGHIFAFAISEPGNDLVLFGSTTTATPQPDGGYTFTGTKVFTSLSPVWTRLGVFGLDTESADAPMLVHGFAERREDAAGAEGVQTLDDWNTIGMRATQSHTTKLNAAPVRAERIFGRRPPGPGAHPIVFGIFAAFEILLSAVYAGIADRALELAADHARARRSLKTGLTEDQNPDTRWKVAEAALAVDGIRPQLHALARDVDELVDHGGDWFRLLAGLKLRTTRTARFVVDQALAVAGGGSYFASSELGRLYRDVLAGDFHPGNEDSVHSTVATAVLGPIQEPTNDPQEKETQA